MRLHTSLQVRYDTLDCLRSPTNRTLMFCTATTTRGRGRGRGGGRGRGVRGRAPVAPAYDPHGHGRPPGARSAIHSCGVPYNCPHCAAIIFPSERSKCCHGGTRILDEVDNPPIDDQEMRLLTHRAASHDSRSINMLLCFAAFGTSPHAPTGRGMHTPFEQPCVTYCQGATYHLWVPPSVDGPARRHALAGEPLMLAEEDSVDRVGRLNPAARDLYNQYHEFLHAHNPFARSLAHMGDRVDAQPLAIRISPSTPRFCDTEVAIVYDDADGEEGPRERFAVTFPLQHDPAAQYATEFIPDYCELYDSMHYVLLFPRGTGGFNQPATRTRRARFSGDTRFLEAAASRPIVARPGPDGSCRPFTLFEWAKAMLYQSFRLRALARLSQAFFLDTFARWQHDEFSSQRNNPRIQQFRAPMRALEEGTAQEERQRVNVRMTSKILGSKKNNQQRIADGMAIVRAYGKPTFFITFVSHCVGPRSDVVYYSCHSAQTGNPNWPEVRELFAHDRQNSADMPQALIRVFNIKLKVRRARVWLFERLYSCTSLCATAGVYPRSQIWRSLWAQGRLHLLRS